ncbi:hypothetical protein ABPG72_020451 [Tetrahymena utriculariae]
MNYMAAIQNAHQKMKAENKIVLNTRLEKSRKLSEKYEANIYLKREDNQPGRTFKIRGSFNYISKMSEEEKKKGCVTASDGNFALSLAIVAAHFQVKAHIFLPSVTLKHKIDNILRFGKEYVEVSLVEANYEETVEVAKKYSQEKGLKYFHSFDDESMIEGAGTIGQEIMKDLEGDFDYCFIPVGGGGLAAGVSFVIKQLSPDTKCIGLEPEGAPAMTEAFKAGHPVILDKISRYCDGSAIRKVGDKPFELCKKNLDELRLVPEGLISSTILNLYDNGLITEPAGAISIAGLELYKQEIKGKNIVCILSGGNTDLSRLDEFKEHSLLYEGLKYFFLITFPLRQGILREFIQKCLGPNDEISHIQFNKKPNREHGPALIAIEVQKKENMIKITDNMDQMNLKYKIINDQKDLYDLLV